MSLSASSSPLSISMPVGFSTSLASSSSASTSFASPRFLLRDCISFIVFIFLKSFAVRKRTPPKDFLFCLAGAAASFAPLSPSRISSCRTSLSFASLRSTPAYSCVSFLSIRMDASFPLSFRDSFDGSTSLNAAMSDRAAIMTPFDLDFLYCVRSWSKSASRASGQRAQTSRMALSPTAITSGEDRSETKLSARLRIKGANSSGGTREWLACAK
mmetsp:Transcript_967/g.2162  ORF Transcript_967/g.2162 Transcript_967/m.2162 type:complete len:214 (+) Transcript_967:515-1156(+)